MNIGNLLNTALKLTGKQNFTYTRFIKRTVNAIGLDVSEYGSPQCLSGSVQPVPRSVYEQMGLDLQANYMTFYVSKDVVDIKRGVSGDQIVYAGMTFKCVSETDWYTINGWTGIMAVQITPDSTTA